MFTASLGGMTFAMYSGFYGRRLIYLASIPFLTLGSISITLSRNVPEMMVWWFIQAFGTSGRVSVGVAVIGDIYKITECGSAMGIFFRVTMLGPALAPLAGVIASHKKYGIDSWHPEERLKAALVGALVLVPLPVLSGTITQYVDGKIGLMLNLICFFVNGVGVSTVLTPLSAYMVDIMHSCSAKVMAASMYNSDWHVSAS
ncbi:hypothetical protein ARMGADRAFT_1081018 [Armillaria gallica]|uniref:Major facilitator superfamily (MFS) profile domain-containing protein n=1 Tax=Armillaria gallica TaxID=47427 RepID=A0A2H3DAH9_ARMGA|nr:hypothetical protein ARMGADRAFT_1081018 [Armillaria gallica]